MDQNKMPLYEMLKNHIAKEPVSFHVPGHKNGLLLKGLDSPFAEILPFDLTELPGLDDLHDPHEAILDAERLLATFYGTYKSYFLVGGSTAGNLSMIMACREGDTVIVQRNCHKSILNGLRLANVRPVFITPNISEQEPLPKMSVHSVKKALELYPETKACIFTYPDYYGQTYDLKAIIEAAHHAGAFVFIDEAHGPHFKLGHPFPVSAVDLGADIIVHSAHKMLPAMTMGAYIHVNREQFPIAQLEFYLGALQSSSPSYPIMASLDMARHFLAGMQKEDISYTLEAASQFRKKVGCIAGLDVKSWGDPLKIAIRHEAYTGFELEAVLAERGIFTELADPEQVLCTLPLLKKGVTFPYQEALKRIKECPFDRTRKAKIHTKPFTDKEKINELAISYREMSRLSHTYVEFEEAVGRIAAKMIIPYPPGIPLFMPGERIEKEKMEQLKDLMANHARFQGDSSRLNAGEIAVFS